MLGLGVRIRVRFRVRVRPPLVMCLSISSENISFVRAIDSEVWSMNKVLRERGERERRER